MRRRRFSGVADLAERNRAAGLGFRRHTADAGANRIRPSATPLAIAKLVRWVHLAQAVDFAKLLELLDSPKKAPEMESGHRA